MSQLPRRRKRSSASFGHHSGTMVVWEKVDRLLRNYANPSGVAAQNALKKIRTDLSEHLSTVYQRFLDIGDPRVERHVRMKLNGEDVLPWNPFSPAESQIVSDETTEVDLLIGT